MLPLGRGVEEMHPTRCWGGRGARAAGTSKVEKCVDATRTRSGPIPRTAGFSPTEAEGAEPTDRVSHEEGHAGTLWPICHGDGRSHGQLAGLSRDGTCLEQ